jgi:putative ABC transport system permease protein
MIALSPRWRKILRDMWNYKTRTAVVVLSIAVGVFAVGTIVTTRMILARDLTTAYLKINPPSAILVADPFDDALLEVLRGVDGVGDVEGRLGISARLQIGPDEWRTIRMTGIGDFDDIRVNQIKPWRAAWPPPDKEILVERNSLPLANAQVGDRVLIEMPDGTQRDARIAGLAHDMFRTPAQFVGNVYGYATLDTMEWLGVARDYTELHLLVSGNTNDLAHIKDVTNRVTDKIEKSGREVRFTFIPTPGEHPADEQVQPLLVILGALGVLALALSGFLVVNTITALLAQQVRQIGVMKAVGARTSQVVGMYLGTVAIYGVLALLVAVPLGAVGAYAFAQFIAGLINFDVQSFTLPAGVLALEIAVGMLVPLLAALWPVISGARVTVREAMSSYGLGRGRFGRSFVDHAVEQVHFVSRPLLISLRNTVRRKARLLFTLSTLVLAGAIFVAVFSVRDSLLLTLDESMAYWNYDVDINVTRPYQVEQLEREALRVPGVVATEAWGFASARRQRPDDTESDTIQLIAPPADTHFLRPTLVSGRWLLPEDQNAIVLNTEVSKEEPDIRVGDDVTLSLEGRDTTWRVVGIVQGVLAGPIAYANYPYFAEAVREVGRASSLQVQTTQHTPAFQTQVAQAVEAHLEQLGINVSSTDTSQTRRGRISTQFNILVVFLMIMALLIAVVGALGLTGTMSINVFERAREIGVMRAIGASDGAVLQIFMIEGILIGLISWFAGSILALPISKLLSDAVGMAFMQAPLHYTFSVQGAAIWVILVVVLAAAATFWPAWSATRLSVRDVLAYE